jgi:hypothetical protein
MDLIRILRNGKSYLGLHSRVLHLDIESLSSRKASKTSLGLSLRLKEVRSRSGCGQDIGFESLPVGMVHTYSSLEHDQIIGQDSSGTSVLRIAHSCVGSRVI